MNSVSRGEKKGGGTLGDKKEEGKKEEGIARLGSH